MRRLKPEKNGGPEEEGEIETERVERKIDFEMGTAGGDDSFGSPRKRTVPYLWCFWMPCGILLVVSLCVALYMSLTWHSAPVLPESPAPPRPLDLESSKPPVPVPLRGSALLDARYIPTGAWRNHQKPNGKSSGLSGGIASGSGKVQFEGKEEREAGGVLTPYHSRRQYFSRGKFTMEPPNAAYLSDTCQDGKLVALTQVPATMGPEPSQQLRYREYGLALLRKLSHVAVRTLAIALERAEDRASILANLHDVAGTTTLEELDPCGKLAWLVLGSWMTYRDAFLIANEFFAEQVVLISNGDISLGPGFERADFDMDLFSEETRRVYVLSRAQFYSAHCPDYYDSGCTNAAGAGSYDTFVFRAPVEMRLADQVDFPQNIWGAESRVLWHFKCLNYSVTNPCNDLITFHHHCESSFRPNQHAHDGSEPEVAYNPHGAYSLPARAAAPSLHYTDASYPGDEFCFRYPWNPADKYPKLQRPKDIYLNLDDM